MSEDGVSTGFRFMETCSVMCNLCREHVGEALHVCFSMLDESACANLCRSCYGAITASAPYEWVDAIVSDESLLRLDASGLSDDLLIRKARAVWRLLMIGEAERMLNDPPEPCGIAAFVTITNALAYLSVLFLNDIKMGLCVPSLGADPLDHYPLGDIERWCARWSSKSSGNQSLGLVFTLRKYAPSGVGHLSKMPGCSDVVMILLEDYLADVKASGERFFESIINPHGHSSRSDREDALNWLRESPPLRLG